MATEVLMPKLGLTMQEGTITAWSVESGATVSAGTVVMTIETDKVEAEVEADADGILSHQAAVGDTLECGEIAGWLLGDGEAPPAGAAAAPAQASDPKPQATAVTPAAPTMTPAGARILASPNARRLAAERGVDLAAVKGTGPGGRITSEDLPSASAAAPQVPPETRFVPYVVRSLAERLDVDLGGVAGSGPEGRVTRDDVYAASGTSRPPSTPADSLYRPGDVVPITGMRGVIAERMAASLNE